jgi:hypothetical protein
MKAFNMFFFNKHINEQGFIILLNIYHFTLFYFIFCFSYTYNCIQTVYRKYTEFFRRVRLYTAIYYLLYLMCLHDNIVII